MRKKFLNYFLFLTILFIFVYNKNGNYEKFRIIQSLQNHINQINYERFY